MALKCDVQYGIGSSGFKLTKVGVSKVRKPVLIGRPGMTNPLNSVVNCSIDIFVDLPATQRGSHLSRNVEVLRSFYRSWGQELEGQDSPPESLS